MTAASIIFSQPISSVLQGSSDAAVGNVFPKSCIVTCGETAKTVAMNRTRAVSQRGCLVRDVKLDTFGFLVKLYVSEHIFSECNMIGKQLLLSELQTTT